MKQQERAYFDYRLADIIGVSIGRLFDKEVNLPSHYEVYPELFDAPPKSPMEDISVARFMQFAGAHNLKMKQRGES